MAIPEITKPVKMWVQNALPLVFDDSLSYYEVLAKFTTYINKLIDDVSELAGSIGDYDSDIAELRTELSDINNEIDNIKNEIQNVESDMTGINERINGVVTRVDSIESAITSINNSVSNLQSDIESLNDRVTTAETSVANLGQAVNEAEWAVSDVISAQTLQENRISALEQNINDVDQNISALQTTVGQHGTDISTLQTTAGQHGTDISALQTTVGQHGTDISTLQTNVNSNTNTIQNQESEISNLKSTIEKYNAFNVLTDKITRTSGTINGFTFTWAGDECTVTGSATGYGANILMPSSALPSDIVPGKTYYVKYKTTDDRVQLRIIWRTANNADIRADYIKNNTSLIVPSTAEKMTVSLFINNDVTLTTPVKVTEIAMLNAESNAELLALINRLPVTYFEGKGLLASGTDLNTVRDGGYYVLSSGYTYPNSPLSSGIGGILVVFNATANTIEQVVYSVGSPAVVNVYVRSAILGNFSFAWKNVSGYVNEYVTQHYENTYNISCAPEITTDTNNYLASTNDNTDRTGDIQALLNSTGVCHLGPGRFVVTGINVPDYASLIGTGIRSVVVLDANIETGYAVKLNTQSSVHNLRISGGSTAQGTSPTVGTRHGIIFEGTKASGQSGGVTKKRSMVDHCIINNFSGGGIVCTGTGIDLDSNMLISDCFVDHCGAGIYIPYYSEFHRISNCAFTYNWYGCVNNGGNNNFSNCDFSGNKIGILIDNSMDQSPNNSHGTFSNCSVNHSYSEAGVINGGTAIKLLKSILGEIFTGMQIFYGAIEIDKCVGTRFIGANVGSKVPITITDSTVVTFSDCTFKEGPNHADSTFTQSGNTVLKFTDCFLRDGTVYNPVS